MDVQTQWLTAADASTYLKVDPRTILRWARTGHLKGFILSGTRRHVWRFLKTDLDGMLDSPSVASGDNQ